MAKEDVVYRAYGYVRASREDRDKFESNTIVNQKLMIENFVKKHPEIKLCDIKSDDGETGVNFERPAFLNMMEDIKAGKINCVIVKDLSRLGRNWLETGQYLREVFPFFNVRFIAINDNYDSTDCNIDVEELMVPFKNLMNESYARDTSIKTRSVFMTKRNSGEFIGAFAPYGYKRSESDKHKLIIDDYAASVVKDIFSWRIEGMSADKIAKKLNSLGILSPMEYKTNNGEKFSSVFKNKTKAEWSAAAIIRILKNETYIGHLVQGKRSSVNYKVKKVEYKPENEWIRACDTHECIISKENFDIANNLSKYDTRSSPNEDAVYLFAGIVFCGDCKQNMIRKTTYSKNKKYFYYICSSHKDNVNVCSTHNFSESKLEKIVLKTIQKHISELVEISEILKHISALPMQSAKINRIKVEIEDKQAEIVKVEQRKRRLYDDYAEGILNKNDFCTINENYSNDIKKCKDIIEKRQSEIEIVNNSTQANEWFSIFTKHQNIEKLDRRLLVTLIDKVFIYNDQRIDIIFKYADKYEEILELIRNAEKEAI